MHSSVSICTPILGYLLKWQAKYSIPHNVYLCGIIAGKKKAVKSLAKESKIAFTCLYAPYFNIHLEFYH